MLFNARWRNQPFFFYGVFLKVLTVIIHSLLLEGFQRVLTKGKRMVILFYTCLNASLIYAHSGFIPNSISHVLVTVVSPIIISAEAERTQGGI